MYVAGKARNAENARREKIVSNNRAQKIRITYNSTQGPKNSNAKQNFTDRIDRYRIDVIY